MIKQPSGTNTSVLDKCCCDLRSNFIVTSFYFCFIIKPWFPQQNRLKKNIIEVDKCILEMGSGRLKSHTKASRIPHLNPFKTKQIKTKQTKATKLRQP